MKSSNVAMKLLAAMLWCVVSVGCVAEEVKPQASSESDQIKQPIQFVKILVFPNYEICDEYLEMLNKIQYTDYPVCERKILPEYANFKKVEWTEITDSDQKEMLVKKGVDINVRSFPGHNNDREVQYWYNSLKKSLDKYEWSLYRADLDMRWNGQTVPVYRINYKVGDSITLDHCDRSNYIFVVDPGISPEEHGARYGLSRDEKAEFIIYKEKPYTTIWGTSATKGSELMQKNNMYPINLSIGDTRGGQGICKYRIKQ